LAVVKSQDKPVSQVCRRFDPVPQILRNVRFKAGQPLADAGVTRAIEDGREKLGKNGRLVVRASGTEPVIRVMGEGDNLDFVERVVEDVCAALSALAEAA
jgi:phosphoglucosamine mutase